jgi:hypothetical protein
MLPLLPGVALLAAGLLTGAEARRGDAWVLCLPFAVLFIVLALGPLIAVWSGHDTPTGYVSRGFGSFHPLLSVAAGALALFLLLRAESVRSQALAIAAASALLIATVSVQCSRGLFGFYDLEPLAKALQPYKQGPIAVLNSYAGEFGFLARLEHPVEEDPHQQLKDWLQEQPEGTAILRHDSRQRLEGAAVVHAQPFRPSKMFSAVRAKPD